MPVQRILVVDDDDGVRLLLGLSLEKLGYKVVSASTGEEALKLLVDKAVDLVITDLFMPEMDGPTLIHQIHLGFPNVRVIAASGSDLNSSEPQISKAKSSGVDAIVPKPFNLPELDRIIRELEVGGEDAQGVAPE